jgi:DNA-binding XRE family transcriptional regulator
MTKRQVARIRYIRQRRTYSVKELSDLLGVHRRTVHQWHSEGLAALEESHPLLFQGQVARDFLKSRSGRRKKRLGPGEFFCMRCRQPRESSPENQSSKPTGRGIGHCKELVLLYGHCCVCGCRMVRFATQQIQNSSVSVPTAKQAESR